MKTIVTGYDGTDQAERALARSGELAQALDAKLVVVSVSRSHRAAALEPVLVPIDPLLVATGPGGPMMARGPATMPRPPETQEPAEPVLLLERARGFLVSRRIEAEYVPDEGDPAACLLGIAEERDADMIVVGSREHGLVDRLLGRPVDEQLARHAHCDVLLVH